MFTILDMLAMVVSEGSFGAYVCLRSPVVLHRDERSCSTDSKGQLYSKTLISDLVDFALKL